MWRAFISLFYPPICTICASNVAADEYLCAACDAKATRITAPFCQTCSEPFSGAITGPFACANCAHRTLYFEAAVAAYRSRGIVRRVVHDFKYGRQVHLRYLVGRWLDARGALDPDFFIETIPYKETREYVSSVLAFSVIYDWRMNGKVLALSARMPRIGRAYQTPTAQTPRKAVVCAAPNAPAVASAPH